MNAKHTSNSQEFYTPPHVIAAVKSVMGGIDYDPASCDRANAIVGAKHYSTLTAKVTPELHSISSVFLNPPGGMTDGQSNMQLWFEDLFRGWTAGYHEQSVFLAFQPSVLRLCPQILQAGLPLAIPTQRLAFWTTDTSLYENALKLDMVVQPCEAVYGCGPNAAKVSRHINSYKTSSEFNAKLYNDHSLLPSRSPSHDNVIVGLPDLANEAAWRSRFYDAFSPFCSVTPAT